MTISRTPQQRDAVSIYGRSYLVTLGLTFTAISVLVWHQGSAEANAWPRWALPLIAVLLIAGVALILFGLFGPSIKMEGWADVLSRHEAALIIMVLAYPVYLFLSPFYGRR